jgi:hypothetical protein
MRPLIIPNSQLQGTLLKGYVEAMIAFIRKAYDSVKKIYNLARDLQILRS